MGNPARKKKVIVLITALLTVLVLSLFFYSVFYGPAQWEPADFLGKAQTQEENGNFSEAAENYKKELERRDHLLQPSEKARVLAKTAELYYKQNKLPEAQQSLEEALSLSPNPSFSFQLGLLYYEQDNFKEAYRFFQQTTPVNADVQKALSLVSLESKEEKDFQTIQSTHFIMKFRREETTQARNLLILLEDAHKKLSKIYPFAANRKNIVKILDDFTFEVLIGKPSQNVSAVSINGKLFIRSPRLNIIGDNMKEIIVHEYVHLLFHKLLPKSNPVWLHEGLAAYLSGEYADERSAKIIRQAVREGKLLPLNELSLSWNALSPALHTVAYAESALLIDYLATRYSWDALYKFIFYLSAGHSETEAVEKIFSSSPQKFQENFTQWLSETNR